MNLYQVFRNNSCLFKNKYFMPMSIKHIRCMMCRKRNKYDAYVSVFVERHPIIIKPMADIELRFYNLLREIEDEGSLQSDHEIKKEKESKDDFVTDVSEEIKNLQTAQDFEDVSLEELQQTNLAPIITEDDKNNILHSINRKLDESLFFLTEQKIGNSTYWFPPQGKIEEGETARQAAERTLQSTCGKDLNVKWYGNSPISFIKYRWNSNSTKDLDFQGRKIFFFTAKFISGSIQNTQKIKWVDRDEIKPLLLPRIYQGISHLLNISK